MAKWGEGDPRWLVQHRDDGKNVNGWHWEEKNKLEWSRARICELLQPVCQEGLLCEAGAALTALSIKEVTGEAVLTTRKGNKRLAVYDLKVTLKWEGEAAGAKPEKVKGEIKIEEFASHSDPDDILYTATAEGTGDAQEKCRSLAVKLQAAIMQQLLQYPADLAAQP